MNILGLQGNFGRPEHDADAVILQDSALVAAIEEERLIRYKCAFGLMPDRAVRYCLKRANISMKDVDVLAFPRTTWFGHEEKLNPYCEFNFGARPKRIEFVSHHLAHASSAYYYSGFKNSLILTIDMTGDGISTSVFRGNGIDIKLIDEIAFPNSLGLFMALITQYLGFRCCEDEGKVMGLATHGSPNIDMSRILKITEDGYEFNPESVHKDVWKRYPEFVTRQQPWFSDLFEKVLPKRRLPTEEINDDHKNIAASAQKAVEDAVFKLIQKYKADGDEYLCLAGGVAQNSVLNGKIVSSGLFKKVYVAAVVGDAGGTLGAATYVQVKSGLKVGDMNNAYLGTDYSNDFIKEYLDKNRVAYTSPINIANKISGDLEDGKIVALFQGRMEFGPRALGNRSLLANPKIDGMKYKVNIIKNREQFRPFAPSILHEHGKDLIKSYQDSPFMSLTLEATDLGYEMLKEATHVDKTARLQSVYEGSGRYREIIESFYSKTGIPGVLNTSLNVGGQPIVESPDQAVALFYSTNVDTLVLDDFVLTK
ncbi:MAG: hypothetical protein ACD_22C00090G0008 [uncultured bacterium]|nr:MAG: hypothetical protein ACD_22C00090G0008 [uncultured bacterium]